MLVYIILYSEENVKIGLESLPKFNGFALKIAKIILSTIKWLFKGVQTAVYQQINGVQTAV